MSVTDAGPIFGKTKIRSKSVTLSGQDQQLVPQEPTRIALIISPDSSTTWMVYPAGNQSPTKGILLSQSTGALKILMVETAGLCCFEWRIVTGGFGSFFVTEVLYNQEGVDP